MATLNRFVTAAVIFMAGLVVGMVLALHAAHVI